MKKVIALATLLTAAGAMAQSASDLSFGDVNYFLKSGQFNLLADFDYVRGRAQTAGTFADNDGWVTELRTGYGLADNLNLVVGVDYTFNFEYETDPKASRYEEDGLSNPNIGLNYRMMNQNTSGLNWDLGLLAGVKIQDAEHGSLTAGSANGNKATGNNSLELNTSVGKKWNEANEWRLTLGGVHNMAGEYTQNVGTGSDIDVDTDAYTNFYLRAIYQYRPVYEFMTLWGAQATRLAERSEDVNGVTKSEVDIESHIDYEFFFTAKYLITQNFMVRANLQQSRLANYDVDSNQAGQSYVVNRRRNFIMGLGVDYLF